MPIDREAIKHHAFNLSIDEIIDMLWQCEMRIEKLEKDNETLIETVRKHLVQTKG